MPLGAELLPNGLPDPSLAQPSRIEVVEAVGASTSFSLSYGFNIEDGDLPLLTEPRLGPDAELAVRVADGAASAVLVRGPVMRQSIRLVTGGEGSVLEVMGADLAIELEREHRLRVWPATTDAAAILDLVSTAGWLPQVNLPGSVVHTDTKNALVQRDSDLALLRRLARRNGCWFWLDYDPLSALPIAKVQRPPAGDTTRTHLYLNGPQRNVDEARIDWDVERVVSTQAGHRDVFGADDIDGSIDRSPLQGLADLALADVVQRPRTAQLSLPVDDAGDLIARSEAALIDDGWFVQATLQVKASVLHGLVRAHTVVELHGAGSRHSGRYLVWRVVHHIDDADHHMDVSLVRNAWNGA